MKQTRKLGGALKGHEPMTFVTWRKDGLTRTVVAHDATIAEYVKFLTNNGFEVINMEGAFWSQTLHKYVSIPA